MKVSLAGLYPGDGFPYSGNTGSTQGRGGSPRASGSQDTVLLRMGTTRGQCYPGNGGPQGMVVPRDGGPQVMGVPRGWGYPEYGGE